MVVLFPLLCYRHYHCPCSLYGNHQVPHWYVSQEVEFIGEIMGVGCLCLIRNSWVMYNSTVVGSSSEYSIGYSIPVFVVATGPIGYSYSVTTGTSSPSSGWLPGSFSIRPSSISHSKMSLVRFHKSKLTPYSVFLNPPDHLLTVLTTRLFMDYSSHLQILRMRPFFKQTNLGPVEVFCSS